MSNVDQFESVFKAAAKTPFRYEPLALRRILVISDLDADGARSFGDETRSFLGFLSKDESVEWRDVRGEEYGTVRELLEIVEGSGPDLICSYRNLQSRAWQWPYSLGTYIDLLTQVTTVPVLLLPHPEREGFSEKLQPGRMSVMALTDHLTGDARLVNYAVRFTEDGGTLCLAHIEDQATFERYLDVISKIPSIDTETARDEILERLLKEPEAYVRSTKEVLEAKGLPLRLERLVTLGHRLTGCVRIVEEKGVNLLVLNTKDQDQLAMHGLAYPLAVELRDTPLLML